MPYLLHLQQNIASEALNAPRNFSVPSTSTNGVDKVHTVLTGVSARSVQRVNADLRVDLRTTRVQCVE